MKSKSDNRLANLETDQYSQVVRGSGKLKLTKNSKDGDKKRKKREKKKKRKELEDNKDKMAVAHQQLVKTRRRFENQSGRREGFSNPEELSNNLTRNQLNKINVLQKREVQDLLKEGEVGYMEKQRRFNKYCQEVTETNEMPCLVMTKIK